MAEFCIKNGIRLNKSISAFETLTNDWHILQKIAEIQQRVKPNKEIPSPLDTDRVIIVPASPVPINS